LPLTNQPGERWLYHMSAEILGVSIARVSGMPLSAFMRQRIFALSVESGCGAVAVGVACLLPSLSSDGAQVALP
jgi:hypothetical protein